MYIGMGKGRGGRVYQFVECRMRLALEDESRGGGFFSTYVRRWVLVEKGGCRRMHAGRDDSQ